MRFVCNVTCLQGTSNVVTNGDSSVEIYRVRLGNLTVSKTNVILEMSRFSAGVCMTADKFELSLGQQVCEFFLLSASL